MTQFDRHKKVKKNTQDPELLLLPVPLCKPEPMSDISLRTLKRKRESNKKGKNAGGTGTIRQFQSGRANNWLKYLHFVHQELQNSNGQFRGVTFPALVGLMGRTTASRTAIEQETEQYNPRFDYPDYQLSAKSMKRHPRPSGFEENYLRAPRNTDFMKRSVTHELGPNNDYRGEFKIRPIALTRPYPKTRKRKRTLVFYDNYWDVRNTALNPQCMP